MNRIVVIIYLLLLVFPEFVDANLMTFSQGTIYKREYSGGEAVIVPQNPGYGYSGHGDIKGYVEDGIYLGIDTDYEVWIGGHQGTLLAPDYNDPHFAIHAPFRHLQFYLTSGGRFNLDSLYLIAAYDRHTGMLDLPLAPEFLDVQFFLTASNGAEFLFPTSNLYQNSYINFGEEFYDIEFFTITVSATHLNDQGFIIDNILITPVPEPSIVFLFFLGLIGLFFANLKGKFSTLFRIEFDRLCSVISGEKTSQNQRIKTSQNCGRT